VTTTSLRRDHLKAGKEWEGREFRMVNCRSGTCEAPKPNGLHIIVERDVGLFSLIQQVVAHIPWALKKNRLPIVHFGSQCAYWTPSGYAGGSTVWEYYFEPVISQYGVDVIPPKVIAEIIENPLRKGEPYRLLDDGDLVSNNFGDHPALKGYTLRIPFRSRDPMLRLRVKAHRVLRDYVRPRGYVLNKAEVFFNENMAGRETIGVHARGTDALNSKARRRGSLILENYARVLDFLLERASRAQIFVATDEQSALDYFRNCYGDRVIAYDSFRSQGDNPVGYGPTGRIMPGYIAAVSQIASRNGEEAIVEYLLLGRCYHLIHNGSGLARTVLLANPYMPHFNVHLKNMSPIERLRRYIHDMRMTRKHYSDDRSTGLADIACKTANLSPTTNNQMS
jgi:hypothetical protein